ncbi:MAG: hypothetical protein R3C44_22400 [Chloroflexota bacterium]
MKLKLLTILAVLVLGLAACGRASDQAATQTDVAAATTTETTGEETTGSDITFADQGTDSTGETSSAVSEALAEAVSSAQPVDSLSDSYRDALPIESQLAFGTLQLESTDQAVTTDQAETLLPLWQALNTLKESGTAADIELEAVVNQIQGSMTPEQLGIIAALQLTEDNVNDLVQSGGLGFGGGFGNQTDDGSGDSGFSFAGGGPGGNGGGPGGGGPPDGGFGGGPGGGAGGDFGGEVDAGARATRIAEMEASGSDVSMVTQMGPTMVVRLLQSKTGQFEQRGFGVMGAAMTAVADATGLDTEAIQSARAEGQTLREIIEANGADVEAVRAAIIEAMSDVQTNGDQDVETMVDDMLDSAFGAGAPQQPEDSANSTP